MDPEELGKQENLWSKKLVLWYYDHWLPVVAGKKWWRDEIKYFYLLTDTQDMAGVQKVNCTVTSEAFGLLVYENYQQVWERQMLYKAKHGVGALLPKSKTQTDDDGNDINYYQAKWSNSSTGQVKYAGWADEAYTRLATHTEWVRTFRQNDEQQDKKKQKYALTIMQEKNKNKLSKSIKDKKKRARQEPPKTAPEPRKIIRIDE